MAHLRVHAKKPIGFQTYFEAKQPSEEECSRLRGSVSKLQALNGPKTHSTVTRIHRKSVEHESTQKKDDHAFFTQHISPSFLFLFQLQTNLGVRQQAKCSTLRQLVDAEEVDREALDEEIHGLDFLVDSARRLCRGAEPIEPRNAHRLRHHVLGQPRKVKPTTVGV